MFHFNTLWKYHETLVFWHFGWKGVGVGERHIEMKHWPKMGWKNYGQQSSSSRGIKWEDPKGYMCFVVKKGKRENLKTVVTRKLNKLNFLKYYYFLPQQEVKNACFLENFVCFVFSSFCFEIWLFPYYQLFSCISLKSISWRKWCSHLSFALKAVCFLCL